MDKGVVSFPTKSLVECCNCGCKCSLTASSSNNGVWIRSVKRKYDEFERSGRFYIPGLDYLPVARVEIENECALLRETVSSQQETIDDLWLELEEERNASSSAANEAMSMILRLQKEKAEIQMEARQFKRFAEEKISHDAQEIDAFEEVLYKREQVIQSLTCEVQAYKHRMMSFGLMEFEEEQLRSSFSRNSSFWTAVGGAVDSPTCSYPPLRCNVNESQCTSELEYADVDVENYPFGETPRCEDLRDLEHRINQLERTPRGDQSKNVLEKFIVGQSPRRPRHSRMYSADSTGSFSGFGRDMGPDCTTDSPRWGTSSKKLDSVTEDNCEDDMSDRVYTVDYVNQGTSYNNVSDPKVGPKLCDKYVSSPRGSMRNVDVVEPEVQKLYMRLQALEADRESMRQTIISMQTDRAQLVLLKEIAQQLYKDMTPERSMPVQSQSITRSFSIVALFKWILSFIFWRKKAHRSKYMFESTANHPGLLLLLEKNHGKLWRCVLSARVRS